MRFFDAFLWILLFYCIYYAIIILYDSFLKRTVKDVTGVQEITVLKPDNKPTPVRSIVPPMPQNLRDNPEFESTIPAYFGQTGDSEDSEGQSSVGEKKKLINTSNGQMVNLKDINIEIPTNGQSISIQQAVDKFMADIESENSLERQELNRLARIHF